MTDEDNSKTIELNRRRVLGGIVTIGGAAAAAGAGTFAAFSDSEDSTSSVNAGTLQLNNSADNTFSATNAVPGETYGTTVNTEYDGTIDAEIDVDFSIEEYGSEGNDPNTDLSATEFAQELEVDEASVDIGSSPHEEDLLTSVSDSSTDGSGNDYVDLNDLVSAAPFDSVTGNTATDGEQVSVTLSLTFRQDAGNDAQADGVDITISTIAEQPSAD